MLDDINSASSLIHFCSVNLEMLMGGSDTLYRVSHLGRSTGLPDAIWPFVPRTVQAKAIV
jgi:hypothetical protein